MPRLLQSTGRPRRAFALGLVALLVPLATPAEAEPLAPALAAKLDGPLRAALASGSPLGAEGLVVDLEAPAAFLVRARESGLHVLPFQGRVAVVEGGLAEARELASMPEVARVGANLPVGLLLDGALDGLAVRRAWEAFGATGDGDGDPARFGRGDAAVAVLDTGVSGSHPLLAGRVIGWKDLVNGQAAPYDDHGHGTHVAGIAAGVAPGAALVGVKVLDHTGAGSFATIARGIEWAVANKAAYGIRVLSLSLGAEAEGCAPRGDDFLSQKVDWAASRGLLVVVAAGNSGPRTCITMPGAARGALTVGSVRDPTEGGFAPSLFSSRGPTGDGRAKPELAAPGEWITSAWPGGGQATLRGTSMATPFVAGAAALLFGAKPSLTAAQAREALVASAFDVGAPGVDPVAGAGVVHPFAALRRATGRELALPLLPELHRFAGSLGTNATAAYDVNVEVPRTLHAAWVTWDVPLAYGSRVCPALPARPNLDLRVLGPSGEVVASSRSPGCPQEAVAFTADSTGKYRIEVSSLGPGAAFRLDASVPMPDAEPPLLRARLPGAAAAFEDGAVEVEVRVSDNVAVAAVEAEVVAGDRTGAVELSPAGPGLLRGRAAPLMVGDQQLRVRARDTTGLESLATLPFLGLEGRAPRIANASVEALSPTSARVRWDTDVPSSGSVEVAGVAPAARARTMAGTGAMATSHELVVAGLRPLGAYALTVRSVNVAGEDADGSLELRLPMDRRALSVAVEAEGRQARASAVVRDAQTGAPLPGAAVEWLVDGRAAGRGTTGAEGAAAWSGPLDPGAHTVAARAPALAGYRAAAGTATLRIAPTNTTLRLEPIAEGARAGARVQLLDQDGLPVAGKGVRVLVDGRAMGSPLTDAEGFARILAPIAAGTHRLEARFAPGRGYGGNATAAEASWAAVLPDVNLSAAAEGRSVRVHASVAADGQPLGGVRVAVLLDGKTRATLTTAADGTASGRWSVAAGEHVVEVRVQPIGLLLPGSAEARLLAA